MPKDNPKLWNMLMQQAAARWPSHRSTGAAPYGRQWAAIQYEQAGGGETNSIKNIDPKKRDYKQEAIDNKKKREKRRKSELKKRGFVA